MNNQCKNNISISPRVDIYENDTQYLLMTDLPGVQSDELDIRYEKEHLEVRVTGESERPNYLRQFHVPDIDHENIIAKLNDGVLRLDLPKALPALAHHIPVSS
jgi:HSP20 family protein